LRLVDASDGVEKSLRLMVGGGTPSSRADLRFGMDDAGEIYLLTKPDGSVRRLIPALVKVPVLDIVGMATLVAILTLAGVWVTRESLERRRR
jgi:hypothetical protein